MLSAKSAVHWIVLDRSPGKENWQQKIPNEKYWFIAPFLILCKLCWFAIDISVATRSKQSYLLHQKHGSESTVKIHNIFSESILTTPTEKGRKYIYAGGLQTRPDSSSEVQLKTRTAKQLSEAERRKRTKLRIKTPSYELGSSISQGN